jgi:hypothetical protein
MSVRTMSNCALNSPSVLVDQSGRLADNTGEADDLDIRGELVVRPRRVAERQGVQCLAASTTGRSSGTISSAFARDMDIRIPEPCGPVSLAVTDTIVCRCSRWRAESASDERRS